MKYNNTQTRTFNIVPSITISLAAAMMLSLAITCPTAQAAPAANTRIPIPNPLTIALRSQAVAENLNLTDQQKLSLDIAVSSIDQKLWKLRDSAPDVRAKTATPLLDLLKMELEQTLTPKQYLRLKQILWQAKGLAAILETDVSAQLSLNDQQTLSIRILLDNLSNSLAAAREKPPYKNEIQNQNYFRKLHSKTENSIVSLLSKSQLKIYSTVFGPLFDISKIPSVACKAPAINTQTWVNSPLLDSSELTGKVTVVHFYAFNCINCKRNLPVYNYWQKIFPPEHFRVIGIHTPELENERSFKNVRKEASKSDMYYPIAVDNNKEIWNAWANNVWPSIYLIDKNGFVRYWWYGELNYKGAESEKWMRSKITELINEIKPPKANLPKKK